MLEPQNYINAQAKYIEQLHALTEDLKKKLVIEQDVSARLRSECSKLQGEIRALADEDSISAGYAKTINELKAELNSAYTERNRLERFLRSAEKALAEKDAELEALKAHADDETNAVNVNLSGIPFKFNFDKKLSPEQEAAFKDTLKETEDALMTLAEGTFLGRLFRQ